METVKVTNVIKKYGNKSFSTKALDGISFSVFEGEFVSVMGPSGSGKTTLLNCISTIDTVTDGSIFLGDKDITKLKAKELNAFRRDHLGFIFQDFNLLDTLTGFENIALALTLQKKSPKDIEKTVNEAAERLGVAGVLSHYPYQMSGGQKQRIATVRALITNPDLVLADEPTGALDSKSSKEVLEGLSEMNRTNGVTIMMVTHDPLAASYSNRVLFLKDGKLTCEIKKDSLSRETFYHNIMDRIAEMGGDDDHAV